MKYVALLRGINVGGNNKVSMKELKSVFENVGLKDVSTYINSGNVIFTGDKRSKLEIEFALQEAIEKEFGLKIKVLLVDKTKILSLAKMLPDSWVNDATMKCDVMFLWEGVDNPEVMDEITIKPGIDTVMYAKGALLWSVDRAGATRSGIQKLIGTELYKHMTVRNANTFRKLVSLIES